MGETYKEQQPMKLSGNRVPSWNPGRVHALFCELLLLLAVAGCAANGREELTDGRGNCSMPMQRGVEYVVQVSTDGSRITEGASISGLRQGVWRTRFRDGHLASKGLYLDDAREGLWVEWNESGQLFSASYYLDGLPDDPWVFWDSSGAVDRDKSGIFEDGLRVGPLSERLLRSILDDVERMSEMSRSQ